jgi:hypothetical protein
MITSEQEIYKNVPAAIHEKIISINSLYVLSIQPKITPIGVNIAKDAIIPNTNVS